MKLSREKKNPTDLEDTQMSQPFSGDTYIRDAEGDSDWEYVPEGQLELPPALEDFFKEQGYGTRWVRYRKSGEQDVSNIEKNKKKGYEYITIKELPEQFQGRFGNPLADSMKDYATTSDMVLMKVLLWKREKVQKYLQTKALNQAAIVRDLLRQNNQEDKYVKNVNESTSKVVQGGTREVNFADKKKD